MFPNWSPWNGFLFLIELGMTYPVLFFTILKTILLLHFLWKTARWCQMIASCVSVIFVIEYHFVQGSNVDPSDWWQWRRRCKKYWMLWPISLLHSVKLPFYFLFLFCCFFLCVVRRWFHCSTMWISIAWKLGHYNTEVSNFPDWLLISRTWDSPKILPKFFPIGIPKRVFPDHDLLPEPVSRGNFPSGSPFLYKPTSPILFQTHSQL